MTSSARGLLVASGTATAVLVVGVLVVFPRAESIPSENTAEAQRPDEADLSLEARRQARLTESQAMLGGGRAAPAEPDPSPEPPETPASPADAAVDGATVPALAQAPSPPPAPDQVSSSRPRRVAGSARTASIPEAAPAPIPRPRGLAWQAAPPPTGSVTGTRGADASDTRFRLGGPCTVATSGTSLVAEACQQGGVRAAAGTMKRLVVKAKAQGKRFTCVGCHVDLDTYTLRGNARADFASLLATAAPSSLGRILPTE
jgi:hypothetical protein